MGIRILGGLWAGPKPVRKKKKAKAEGEGTEAKAESRIHLRGFGSMGSRTRKRIAGMGGRASVLSGNGHRFTPKEAAQAGRKGGKARWAVKE